MRKSILILACSLMASSLSSAMSFTDDIVIVVQDADKVQWKETKSFEFEALDLNHFISTPTILENVPQIPIVAVNEIKVVELWSFILPKSYILKSQISVKHQKIFKSNSPGENSSLNLKIPLFQRQD